MCTAHRGGMTEFLTNYVPLGEGFVSKGPHKTLGVLDKVSAKSERVLAEGN